MPEKDRSALEAELQDDMNREEIASAFRATMISHFRAHVPGTQINEKTLLNSDYLGQFHELVALFGALSNGKGADRIGSWRPVPYEEHFADAGLAENALALAAYRRAPPEIRARFDEAVAKLQAEALRLVAMAGKAQGPKTLAKTCAAAADRLEALIGDAAAIANGDIPARQDEPAAGQAMAV